MTLISLFPTRVFSARLRTQARPSLNAKLLREIVQLQHDDIAGRRWSKERYPGGYTSYASANRMHQHSPSFAALEKQLDRAVTQFVAELQLDLGGNRLRMSDCWVNVNPRGARHPLHLHPLSVISGTYYVQVPRGAPGLKFEDPRLDRYMATPPRKANAAQKNQAWVTLPATSGQFFLFESWLRHEVPPNPVAQKRVSISFNYAWE